jgi:hypothetical protein
LLALRPPPVCNCRSSPCRETSHATITASLRSTYVLAVAYGRHHHNCHHHRRRKRRNATPLPLNERASERALPDQAGLGNGRRRRRQRKRRSSNQTTTTTTRKGRNRNTVAWRSKARGGGGCRDETAPGPGGLPPPASGDHDGAVPSGRQRGPTATLFSRGRGALPPRSDSYYYYY